MANKYQQLENSNKAMQEMITSKLELIATPNEIYRRYISRTIGWCDESRKPETPKFWECGRCHTRYDYEHQAKLCCKDRYSRAEDFLFRSSNHR